MNLEVKLRRERFKDLEDMLYRMELTYDEIIDILDIKAFAGLPIGYTLLPGTYEIGDSNSMVKSSLPNQFMVKITKNDLGVKSILTTIKKLSILKRFFFHTNLSFAQLHLGPLGDIEGFVQKIPGS